jgi:hypothetical protein
MWMSYYDKSGIVIVVVVVRCFVLRFCVDVNVTMVMDFSPAGSNGPNRQSAGQILRPSSDRNNNNNEEGNDDTQPNLETLLLHLLLGG